MLLVRSSSSEFEDNTDSEDSIEEEEDHLPATSVDASPELRADVPLSLLNELVHQKRAQIDALRFQYPAETIREYEKLLNVVVYSYSVEGLVDDAIVQALIRMVEHCWTAHFDTAADPKRLSTTPTRPRIKETKKQKAPCHATAHRPPPSNHRRTRSSTETVQEEEEEPCAVEISERNESNSHITTRTTATNETNTPRDIREAGCDATKPSTASALPLRHVMTPGVIIANRSVAQYLQDRGGRAETALLDAASQDGRLDVVQYVSEHYSESVDVSTATTSLKYTALHLACAFGHVSIVEYLIRKGVDVNIPGGSGRDTALHLAIEALDAPVFDCLVASGKVHMDAANAAGETAWCLAASNGFWHGVQYLLEHGHAKVNDPLGCFQETVLHVACHTGDLSMVRYLMVQGADAEACNRRGETALHVAVRWGLFHVVEYLIDIGQVPALARSHVGSTALSIACARGDVQMVRYLMRVCPASVSIPNAFGRTPLQVAEDNGHWHVMCCLLDDI